MNSHIFWPVVCLVALTAAIWVLMYWQRINEMRERNITPQSLSSRRTGALKLKNTLAADNFSNLLEVPILFYLLCIIVFVMGEVSKLQLVLAWLYVVLRYIHSFIHVTYNNVVQRWFVYVTSTVCLFIMWALFAVSLFWQNDA